MRKNIIIITAIIIFIITSVITVFILSASIKDSPTKTVPTPITELLEQSKKAYEEGSVTTAKMLLNSAKSQPEAYSETEIKQIDVLLKMIEKSGKKDATNEPIILVNEI